MERERERERETGRDKKLIKLSVGKPEGRDERTGRIWADNINPYPTNV